MRAHWIVTGDHASAADDQYDPHSAVVFDV